ncbi:Uncharacterised protein [Enterobacter cancerogenus]|uniref:Uncharacterized protein n=1 Tax=Enterobacter cancerogenus TaxID=69218 RepID=A0A484ZAV4_9ENTR|nr:Uncharacterised protein [Enterobacter cancerogenus]
MTLKITADVVSHHWYDINLFASPLYVHRYE